jgi:hypothetical protein
MAKLSDILSTREIKANETNLEKGRVWTVSPTTMYTCIYDASKYCWVSPGCGTLTIEMWGAAGSSARMCCCGFGLPGNAPGYTKKTIAVYCGSWICACPGMSCNAHDLCFSGCGVPTYLAWACARDLCGYSQGCMCAQGGRGGTAICSTGTSAYCCFLYCTFCTTQLPNSNCGIVCNHCPSGFIGCGYGGDTNCCGGISYVAFKGCLPSCPCQTEIYLAAAPGVYGEKGAFLAYTLDSDPEYSQWSGAGKLESMHATAHTSRWPAGGIGWQSCYSGQQSCGCYDSNGCTPYLPYGVGAPPPFPCDGVRDHGKRGGHGNIRLTYRGSNSTTGQNCAKLGGAY